MLSFPAFDKLFNRKPAFDFGTGKGSLQKVLDAVNAANRAGDEAQLRAIWEHLEQVTPRDATGVLETNKPIYSGRILGSYLNAQKRFVEVEKVLAQVKLRRKAGLTELVEARFALADAIWGQGDRDRAEQDALVLIDKLLQGRAVEWPVSAHFVKLAKYRYDFETCARFQERAFEVPPFEEAEGAETERKSLRTQVEANRASARMRLENALTWHDAGQNSQALLALEKVYECDPTPDERMMALNLEFFWRNSRGDDEKVQKILEEMKEMAAHHSENTNIQRRLIRTQAYWAQWNGDLFQADALLNSIGVEAEDAESQRSALARVDSLILQSEWEAARQICREKVRWLGVPNRTGARMLAIVAMAGAYIELRAHCCGAPAHQEEALKNLMRAIVHLRGIASFRSGWKLLIWCWKPRMRKRLIHSVLLPAPKASRRGSISGRILLIRRIHWLQR